MQLREEIYMNILYHGSNVEVPHPRIPQNAFYKDFGYGFYCNLSEKHAKQWALTKKGESIVNLYEYIPNSNLNILEFKEMCGEWLDFIKSCRRGVKHDYDIVHGPMADDGISNFLEEFLEGNISKEAFRELVKFRNPTHQICFKSKKALETLTFKGSEIL